MRKITKNAIDAFMNNKHFNRDNTYVSIARDSGNMPKVTTLYLHDSPIAYKYEDGTIEIQTCGWNTHTTKERLNGIPGVQIYQLQGKWYLNEVQWDGKLRKINKQWYEIY